MSVHGKKSIRGSIAQVCIASDLSEGNDVSLQLYAERGEDRMLLQ